MDIALAPARGDVPEVITIYGTSEELNALFEATDAAQTSEHGLGFSITTGLSVHAVRLPPKGDASYG